MNAAQTHTDPSPASVAATSHPPSPPAAPAFEPSSGLSALVDGEADEADWAHWLTAQTRSDSLADWHSYQVIGDVLRTSAPAVSQRAPQDFLAGFHARLQAEAVSMQATPVAPATPVATPVAKPAALAVPDLPAAPVASVAHVRAPAANDALFRWKLVAGVASLAAVMAVSWTVLGAATGGASGAAAQLAASGNPTGSAAVVVNTVEGPVLRDPQLEALMAEHRQYGGMSALQMPAGFLRNATYDANGR
jgi:sigma-E factor negative regulatory protein RseA